MKTITSRTSAALAAMIDLGREFLIGFDQLANALTGVLKVLAALISGERQAPAYADETLSARTWRAARRGKTVGLIARPVIDFLFAWQKPDPAIKDERGAVVTGHCHRAYLKEQLRRGLPPEYREATALMQD